MSYLYPYLFLSHTQQLGSSRKTQLLKSGLRKVTQWQRMTLPGGVGGAVSLAFFMAILAPVLFYLFFKNRPNLLTQVTGLQLKCQSRFLLK